MAPWLIPLITAGGGLLSSLFQGSAQKKAAQAQAQSTTRAAELGLEGINAQLDFQREAGEKARRATEMENIRRSQEAGARAGRLEDVVKMFQGMEMPSRPGSIDELLGAGREMMGRDYSQLGGIAQALLGADDSVDLRKSAQRELSKSSDMMAALMAQQGVRGSGFAAGQQRELGADVMSRLADRIATSRRENLMAGAGVLGQQFGLEQGSQGLGLQALSAALSGETNFANLSANTELQRLAQIANIYGDEAFGADLAYNPRELEDMYNQLIGQDQAGGGDIMSFLNLFGQRGGSAPTMYAGGSKDFYRRQLGDRGNYMLGG